MESNVCFWHLVFFKKALNKPIDTEAVTCEFKAKCPDSPPLWVLAHHQFVCTQDCALLTEVCSNTTSVLHKS